MPKNDKAAASASAAPAASPPAPAPPPGTAPPAAPADPPRLRPHSVVDAVAFIRDQMAALAGQETTAFAGELLGAVLDAGGRLVDVEGNALRALLGTLATRGNPSLAAGEIAQFITSSFVEGARQIANGDASRPRMLRLAEILASSKDAREAGKRLDEAHRADEAARSLAHRQEHEARMGRPAAPSAPHQGFKVPAREGMPSAPLEGEPLDEVEVPPVG